MSADTEQDRSRPSTGQEVAALVRAIRRAYQSPSGPGGLERFTVTDIHDFARRLVAEGVRSLEDEP